MKGKEIKVMEEKKEDLIPDLTLRIESIIFLNQAGSPTNPDIKWTHLKPQQISKQYEEKWSEKIGHQTLKRLLNSLGYKRRRPIKALPMGKSPYRKEQFEIVFFFAYLFAEMDNNPILSKDTKKKEKLGDFSRKKKHTEKNLH